MNTITYIGEDCVLGRFGFVRKGDKVEVTDKELDFIKAKSADQFDFASSKAPKTPAKPSEVLEGSGQQEQDQEAPTPVSGESEGAVVSARRRRSK